MYIFVDVYVCYAISCYHIVEGLCIVDSYFRCSEFEAINHTVFRYQALAVEETMLWMLYLNVNSMRRSVEGKKEMLLGVYFSGKKYFRHGMIQHVIQWEHI